MLLNEYTITATNHGTLSVNGFTSIAILEGSRMSAPFTVYEIIETARGAFETVSKFKTAPVTIWISAKVDTQDPARRVDSVTTFDGILENIPVEYLRDDDVRLYKLVVSVNGFELFKVEAVPEEVSKLYTIFDVTCSRKYTKTFRVVVPACDSVDARDLAEEIAGDYVINDCIYDDYEDDVEDSAIVAEDITEEEAEGFYCENSTADADDYR